MKIFVAVHVICSLTFILGDSSEDKRTHSLKNNGPQSELHPAEGTMKEMLHHWMNVDKKDQKLKFKNPLTLEQKNKISILLQSPEFRAKIFDKMNDYIENGEFDAVDDFQNFGSNRFADSYEKFKSQDFKNYLKDQMSLYKRKKRYSSFLDDDDVNWQDYHKKRSNNVVKFSFPPEASKYNSHMRHKRMMPGMIADPHAILEEFSSFLTPDKRGSHSSYRNPFNRFRFSKKGIQFTPTNQDLVGLPSGNLFSNFQDPEDEIIGGPLAYNYNPNQNKLSSFSQQMSQYGLKKRNAGRSFLTLPSADVPNYFDLLSQLKKISDDESRLIDHNESGKYEVKKRLFGKWDMDNLRSAIRNNNGLMKRSRIWNMLMSEPDQGEDPASDPWSVDYGTKFVKSRGNKIGDLYSDRLSNH